MSQPAPLPRRLTVITEEQPDVELAEPAEPLSVLLVTEATYPFAMGGVSTWCDQLVRALPEVTFHLTALVAEPDVEPRFVLPPNVASVHTQPLWGIRDPKESWHDVKLRQVLPPRARTTDAIIRTRFVPLIARMLELVVFAPVPQAAVELPDVIADLHRYLQRYDYVRSVRHPATWDALTALLRRAAEESRTDLGLPEPTLAELTTAVHWVCRWLFPLAVPIPRVDVVHIAMAGSCSLIAAAAAREHGAAVLLTEHGVYLRERYLAERGRRHEFLLKLIGLRFARAITAMTYSLADQVSPCCDFNQTWERRLGADPSKLVTVYYGLPGERFATAAPIDPSPHTVVWLGRINPLKDLETLLRAASVVTASRPDVVFRLYGGAGPEEKDYERRCHALHEELGLGDAVVWAGVTSDSAAAFATGDLVVLSSISEGFPYSTLEAMLSGRAVVATNVGGLTEQIGPCGRTVEPRNPEALAAAILEMFADPATCHELGAAARLRALRFFGEDRFRAVHLAAYLALSPRHQSWRTHTWALAAEETPAPVAIAGAGTAAASEDGDHGHGDVLSLPSRTQLLATTVHRPVDTLEIAAALESDGTVAVLPSAAGQDGDAEEAKSRAVFALAEQLFAARHEVQWPDPAPIPEVVSRVGSWWSGARFPLWNVLPPLAALAIITAAQMSGGVTTSVLVALALGVGVGMSVSAPPALALGALIGRLILRSRWRALASLLALTVAMTVALAIGAAALLLLVPGLPVHDAERVWLLTGAGVAAASWLLVAAASLIAAMGGAALVMALAAVGYAATALTAPSLAGVGLVVLAAVLPISLLLVLTVVRWHRGRSVPRRRETLPRLAFLWVDTTPVAVYAVLSVILLSGIHVVAWHVSGGFTVTLRRVEVALLLGLAPLLLAIAITERLVALGWRRAAVAERAVLAAAACEFARLARRWHLAAVLTLLVTSGAVALVVAALARLNPTVHSAVADEAAAILPPALTAACVLAVGVADCLLMLSLRRPGLAMLPLLAGIAVLVSAPLSLTASGPTTLGWVLLGAAVPPLVLGELALHVLLRRADHTFYAAV